MKAKMNVKDYLKLKYPLRIIEDEGRGWFVEIPDLPGCMTVVEKFEDAHEAIEECKEAWIEFALEDGQDIPLPSTERKYSGKFSLRIPPSLHERLVEQAEAEDLSLNAYCLYLLSLGTGRRERARVEPIVQKAAERAASVAK
jgi:predicted RNase H-like HicB family nuclease